MPSPETHCEHQARVLAPKNIMKIINHLAVCAALSGLALSGATSFAATSAAKISAVQTTNFAVSKMTCEGCANGLNASLKDIKGVKSARVDFKTKRATIAYDNNKTSDAKLLAFFKAAGFPAKVAK